MPVGFGNIEFPVDIRKRCDNMADTVIAATLYTVRNFVKTPSDIAASLKKIRAIGYRAIQVSTIGPIEPEELRRIADGEGLEICATHINFNRIRDDMDAVIAQHDAYGCRHVATGSMPREFQGDAEGIRTFARQANEVGRKLAEAGKTFSYHNHWFEFQRFDGDLVMDMIYGETDPKSVLVEIDVAWLARGGACPTAWIRKLSDRMKLLHLKDLALENEEKFTTAEVGEGNLDWPSILKAAAEAGIEWYIVEQDFCTGDPFDSLKISLENLRAMGLR